jgi:hypothetical protein
MKFHRPLLNLPERSLPCTQGVTAPYPEPCVQFNAWSPVFFKIPFNVILLCTHTPSKWPVAFSFYVMLFILSVLARYSFVRIDP